jgi:enoyl-CoA hydratase/carnithine racemase
MDTCRARWYVFEHKRERDMNDSGAASAHQFILVSRAAGACEITFNRPDRMNAMNAEMAAEILDVLAQVEAERETIAVIFAGNERAFCAGADLGRMSDKPEDKFDVYRARYNQQPNRKLFRALNTFTKPVISAVEGYCLGGGMELALFGDIIVAGDAAQFGLPEARHGLIPGAGGTQNLPRLIGKALAKEMMWTARRISAHEAKEFRLVNHVVPKGKALEKAREIVGAMAKNGPLSLMMIKQAVDRGLDMPLMTGFLQEADLAYMLAFSEDRTEGLKAFAEKRDPKFKGQ